jgi:phenylacetaldehyde dehydrogenase
VTPNRGKSFDVFDPATGQAIAAVAEADAADIDEAVKAARRAFESGPWARTSPADRCKLIWKLADLLESHADQIAELEALDNGKPIRDARNVDLPGSYEILRYMAGWTTKINGSTITVSSPGDWHAYTLREPVGVVGQIIPWNFPLMMAAWKIAPALAAGCTIVLKPAEQTPLSALRLGQLIQEAGFPDGVVNILTGLGETAGAALAAHPDVDKVHRLDRGRQADRPSGCRQSEEGISGARRKVAGDRFPRCRYGSRDQRHVERDLLQHGTVLHRRLAPLRAQERLRPADAGCRGPRRADPRGSWARPRDPARASRLRRAVQARDGILEAGRQQGAQVVTGGSRVGDHGYFVQPTVLTETKPEMSVVREEIFGPVVCAIPFDDDDLDRIARTANDTPYGLAASIWTRDLGIAHKLARRIKAGTVWINTHNFGDPALPFGGFKQSGWGREMGFEAIELYTEVKAVAVAL